MQIGYIDHLVCPQTKTKLSLIQQECHENGTIHRGALSTISGITYPIENSIPNFISPDDSLESAYAINLFRNKASIYDKFQHLSFELFGCNEADVRESLIKKLNLNENYQILEASAGTGRDSVLIKKHMKQGSVLHVQDISMDMLQELKKKFTPKDPVCITQSNSLFLPYKDKMFDCIYSFGGIGMNTYADNKKMFKEVVRVAKPGAKVVIGGLSLAPWLYQTEFGMILRNHNTHYENKIILEDMPIEARDVTVSWILNGAGFCLEFTIGEGEPTADFDFKIPGDRGGTLRTRYYGKLEGVSPEVKRRALKACSKSGLSMYEFLNQAVSSASTKILGQENEK